MYRWTTLGCGGRSIFRDGRQRTKVAKGRWGRGAACRRMRLRIRMLAEVDAGLVVLNPHETMDEAMTIVARS